MIVPTVPTGKMSSGVGSLVFAFFCAARKISLSRAIASSSALMRPLAPDEELRHHVREHDDVAQREERDDAPLRGAALAVAVVLEEHRISASAALPRRPRLHGPDAAVAATHGAPRAASGSGELGFLLVDDERRLALRDDVLVDDDFLDAAARGDVVHDVEHRVLEDGAQTARAAVARERLARDGARARPW